MNFFMITTILSLIACGMAFPLTDDNKVEERADRQRRVTCDLLGFLGDSACAANCLSMGKSGGTCQNGICVCRRDNFEDLFNKRFPPDPNWNGTSYQFQ